MTSGKEKKRNCVITASTGGMETGGGGGEGSGKKKEKREGLRERGEMENGAVELSG